MESQRDLGTHLTLDEFLDMGEREQFAYAFVAVKAITHLERAGKEATTILERVRSNFGAFNLKKNLDIGRGVYDEGK